MIGIHTSLEDYQLAFFLNKYLNIHLKKASYGLDFKGKNGEASYTVFEYNNEELDYNLYVLSNICILENKSQELGLFDKIDVKAYLLPEKKNVDYFIKIDGAVTDVFVEEILQDIRKVTKIITSYIIETNTLKSKDFLIF